MELTYNKSGIYSDHYIIWLRDKSDYGILCFNYIKNYFHIEKIDFINMMKKYNGTNRGLSYNMNGSYTTRQEFDYIFFKSEDDVKNAIDFLERTLVIVKLIES